MKGFIIILLVALSSGCAILDEYQGKAAKDIAIAVSTYCIGTPAELRADLRAEINELAAPNSIAITCGE